jgi:hypothetical protein
MYIPAQIVISQRIVTATKVHMIANFNVTLENNYHGKYVTLIKVSTDDTSQTRNIQI